MIRSSVRGSRRRWLAVVRHALIVAALSLLVAGTAPTLATKHSTTVSLSPFAEESGVMTTPTAGEVVAGFALTYAGYPYVAAGNSPAGFDCSGFTQYVVLNTLGIDIRHGVEGQQFAGPWVNWGDWQPGDLVFFQNTYQPGISHAGIYIGDGLFIHAENETTGVVITSVYSDYYASRYYGAVRVA